MKEITKEKLIEKLNQQTPFYCKVVGRIENRVDYIHHKKTRTFIEVIAFKRTYSSTYDYIEKYRVIDDNFIPSISENVKIYLYDDEYSYMEELTNIFENGDDMITNPERFLKGIEKRNLNIFNYRKRYM